MKSDLFSNNLESSTDAQFVLQNSKMLRVNLNGTVSARQGSIVGYQGQADCNYQGAGGIGKMLKQKLTGEGVATMTVTGQGDVFFADQGRDVHLIYLEGDAISINGRSVLAYDTAMDVDVHLIQGGGMMSGGLFNTIIRGTGWVAITSDGPPVVLQTDAPTFVDSNAVVCWSANLQTTVARSFKMAGLIGRGTGEAVQIGFAGQGWVIVQPSELDLAAMNQGGAQTGAQGGLGGLLGR